MTRVRITKDRLYSKNRKRGITSGITKEATRQLKSHRETERPPREK
jgi:hypothetical protein